MISARMATFPARRMRLRKALTQLTPQVDEIRLCLNEYDSIPEEISDIPKVYPAIPDVDLKDVGKFMFDANDKDEVFLVDDDIDYPEDYVYRTRQAARNAAALDNAVFGYHGTVYRRIHIKRRVINAALGRGLGPYPPGSLKDLYSFHKELTHARIVSQLGTGTVYCLGANLPDIRTMSGSEQRVDVRMAAWAARTGRRMIALPRTANWIPTTEDNDSSIYHKFTQYLPQELICEIESFGFSVPNAGKRI